MKTHKKSKTRIYAIWKSIRYRCLNKNANEYKWYGGRGIGICDRWKESFENFFEDMQQGYSDNLSIDRIDNEKGYSKENCKWSTKTEQARNRRSNRMICFNKQTKTLQEWSDIYKLKPHTLRKRIEDWGVIEKSFTLPVAKRQLRSKPQLSI